MITSEQFEEAIRMFEKLEEKGSFYDISVELYRSGRKIEAYLLILATWNSGSFRYAIKDFDIKNLISISQGWCL